jgi:antitoxin component YwqK of YwqJK toxin-antitoxin module
MKKSLLLLIITIGLFSACQQKEIREEKYDNGQIKEQFYVIKGKNDAFIKTGEYLYYYENGQIAEKGTYKNNKLNGAYKKWFENGILKTDFAFKDNKVHGTYKNYNEDGILLLETNYDEGASHGKCTLFNNNKKEIVGQYNAGKADGKWEVFENEQPIHTIELKDGVYTKQASTAKSYNISDAETVSFFGFELNRATYSDVKLGFLDKGLIPVSFTEPHPQSGGKVIKTTGEDIELELIKDIYFVFNPNDKLIAIQFILPKNSRTKHSSGFRAGFNFMYDLLKPDYKLVSKRIPFVGNTYAKFKRNNSYILVDAQHLSHDVTVSFWLEGYKNVVI